MLTSEKQAAQELEVLLQKMISSPTSRRAFLAALPFLFSACATRTKTRYREGDNTGQKTGMSVEDEKRMTQEVLPEMRKDYPALDDAPLQNYVSSVGKRVVAANQLEGKPYNYSFTVVAVPQVNAFALPAGTVFVTAPLIAMADTEAELAGVIGHEIGHIKARHTAERMERAKENQTHSILGAIGGGLLGGAAGFGIGKLVCKQNDKRCLGTAAGLGAAAGAAGGFLIAKYGFMANSQEDEMEADRVGFRTAVAAGYDKDQVGSFYSKLQRMDEAHKKNQTPLLAGVGDAMSTHPPSRERVAQMNEMAASTVKQPRAIVSTKDFDRARGVARVWAAQHGAG